MKRKDRAAQARRELDKRFAATDLGSITVRPRVGWIRAIRGGLGMSQASLAQHLMITQAAVASLERSEMRDTITIGRLTDVARAMDCTLVYALVPNSTLEDTVRTEAERRARASLDYVANTMALEDQAVDESDDLDRLQREVDRIIDDNRVWPTG
jgi:predicted DNA-binding mobile mystery protein A